MKTTKRILECVPNFSEGTNENKIKQLMDSISQFNDVKVLHVDQGKSANRTVITFAGKPEAVVEAAFQVVKKASEIIDMRTHKGQHPRIGATDVLPLVPISGISIEEAVLQAHRLGNRIGNELGIPGYFYEHAATCPERKNLANCRKGEYEGLPEKLENPDWKPDFGPTFFNPQVAQSGATVLGVRNFLIAYNLNLNTNSVEIAKKIAREIRESGYTVKDESGNTLKVCGLLKSVKAIGWYIDEFGKAQVSCNLTNWEETPPHVVFETAKKVSEKYNVQITGSELIGLIPLKAMLQAGRFFAEKQGLSFNLSEAEFVDLAIMTLGLNELAPFEHKKRILEYLL